MMNEAILFDACISGDWGLVDLILRVFPSVDPRYKKNGPIGVAARGGHLEIVERLLQDERVDPADDSNWAINMAAQFGHLAIVERLLQDDRVDPGAYNNYCIRWASYNGHLAVVDLLLQDKRVDPSVRSNYAVRFAALHGHTAIVDRLIEDSRVDAAVAIFHTSPENLKRFECRERFTEICIALQGLDLPAWVTVKILTACKPWSTLKLHQKWKLVCTVKHFH